MGNEIITMKGIAITFQNFVQSVTKLLIIYGII
jgi:hypothetical protein